MTTHILVSNDDGVFATGIRTLANTLAAAGYRVTVVCPDRERSATGHGLTLHKPIRANRVDGVFAADIAAWACSGTPSDCVKLALGALLETPPDFVVSGINHGPNLGTDVLYSGTVSAAMEGTIENIPSIAMSLGNDTSQEFQPAANFACRLVQQLQANPIPASVLLSVNVPAGPEDAIAGVKTTRLGVRRYIDEFEKRIDPRGKTYFWLAGEVLEEVESPDAQQPNLPLTDMQAIRENYIAVTPLHYDLTYYSQLPDLVSALSPICNEPCNPRGD
jgi:5'-nucleotidase